MKRLKISVLWIVVLVGLMIDLSVQERTGKESGKSQIHVYVVCDPKNLCELLRPCRNGGTCTDTTESGGVPGFVCRCAYGFGGELCSHSPPHINLDHGPIFFLEKTDATLPKCHVTGFPTPEVKWSKVGRRLSVQSAVEEGELKILNVTQQDAGQYRCTATNSVGTDSSEMTVEVFQFVVKPPEVQIVSEGSDVEAGCKTTGTETPYVTWAKSNGELPAERYQVLADGTMRLKEVQIGDAGRYVCTMKFWKAQFEAEMQVYVEVKKDAWKGQNLSIACSAKNDSKLVVTWSKVSGELPRGRSQVLPDGTLNLVSIEEADAGRYVCTTSGDGSEIHSGMQLTVREHSIVASSKILQGYPDYSTELEDYLGLAEMGGKAWKLCYRASENNFSSHVFHVRCNYKGPTVTVVRVDQYVFGGYSDKGWISSGHYMPSTKAFLFSLKNQLNKAFKSGTYRYHGNAIFGCVGYGPTFGGGGGGHDLYLANQCHLNKNSYTDLGQTYQPPFGYATSSDEAKSILAGSIGFKCDEYEVYFDSEHSIVASSKILQDHPASGSMRQLPDYLRPVEIGGQTWILCFRASGNHFLAQSFHTKCNYKGPTVTLVRVGQYVFGGYTDQDWTSSGNYISTRKAFLFSLKNHLNQAFKTDIYRHHGNAIYGNTSYGPTFGGGHDLYLSNQCHLNTNSFTNVGHTYRPPLGYNYTSAEAKSAFAGSYHFRCDEYEVFHLNAEYQIIPSSKILQGYAGYSRQLADYLRTVVMAGKTWKLCFRASENNFLSESFHAHCDDQGPTVTLVRVGEYVFGGYTDRAWNSSGGYISSREAFLFSLKNHLNRAFKSDTYRNYEYAVKGTSYGPTFGGGPDLFLADQCNVNTTSSANLGHTYLPPFGYAYDSAKARSAFAKSYNFRCDEYEVFYQGRI